MQQPFSPTAETYLDALRQAQVVDHVLEVALPDSGAEIALLDSIQGIANGPVFRVSQGSYAFRLPPEQIAPLTDALSDADGTLRALTLDERAVPVLDEVGVALVQAVGEAADSAAPVLTQAVVSAAFAVEAARMAADGIGAGSGLEALRVELAAIRESLDAGTATSKPLGDRWLVDLAAQTEMALRHVASEDLARKEDVEALGARFEAVLATAGEKPPAEEKVFALLRQRLERLQASSDKLIGHLGPVDGVGPGELLHDVEMHLRSALAEMQRVPEFGPFQPGFEPVSDGPARLIEALERALTLLAERPAVGEGSGLLYDRLNAGFEALQETLGARSGDADALSDIQKRLADLSDNRPEGTELALAEVRAELGRLGQRLVRENVSASDLVAGSVEAAAERTVAGLDDLKAGLDMRLQTVISRDGGLAEQIGGIGVEIRSLKDQIEAWQGAARSADATANLASRLIGLERSLAALPETGAEATRGLFAGIETRIASGLEDVRAQGEALLEFARNIETPEARQAPFEALGAEARAAHLKLGENVARVSTEIAAQDARISEALGRLEGNIERQITRLDGFEASLAGVARTVALAETDSRLETHAADTEQRLVRLTSDIAAQGASAEERSGALEERTGALDARLEAVQVSLARTQDKVARLSELPDAMDRRFSKLEAVLDQINRNTASEARDQAAVATALSEILRRLDHVGSANQEESYAASLARKSGARGGVADLRTLSQRSDIVDSGTSQSNEGNKASHAELQHDLRLMLAEYLSQDRGNDAEPSAETG